MAMKARASTAAHPIGYEGVDMASGTKIEWTDTTWNPVTGCQRISPGCKHCYAARLAPRLRAMGSRRYSNGFDVTLHHDLLDSPKRWARPRRVFVNSMSDLFHDDVPDSFIQAVFDTIENAAQHTFQVLTKRPERAAQMADSLTWSANLWMGVSVENSDYIHRVHTLQGIPARTRFLSLEPLLGSLPNIPLQGIDWVITGGESGPRARRVNPDWVRDIREQCVESGASFFFKQWGGARKNRTGRELDGRTWDEFPSDIREVIAKST